MELPPKSTNVECQGNVYIDTDKLHAAQSASGAVMVLSSMDTMDKQNFSNVYLEQVIYRIGRTMYV
jgi:hypothetical protein